MMSVIAGLVLGYVLGRKLGPMNYEEINQAWDKIRTSEEVRDTVVGGRMILSEVLQEQIKKLTGRGASKPLRKSKKYA